MSSEWKQKTVRCSNPKCNLLFAHEEVRHGLFYEQIDLCARCWVYKLLARKKIKVGPCFGVSFEGISEECRKCKLNPGCRIEMTDRVLENPDAGIKNRRKTSSNIDYLIRVLRMVGRPMHVQDLVPLVLHLSGGQYLMTEKWRAVVRGRLNKSDQAVFLGRGFYVWIGYDKPGKERQNAVRSIPLPGESP